MEPPAPRAATETPRQALRRWLVHGPPWTTQELSQAIGASEREVRGHLEALSKGRSTLAILPSRCVACGFEARPSFKRPGRCPRCRETRMAEPRFSM